MTDADEDRQRDSNRDRPDQTRHSPRQRLFQSVGTLFRLRRRVLDSQNSTATANQAHTLPTTAHFIPSSHLAPWLSCTSRRLTTNSGRGVEGDEKDGEGVGVDRREGRQASNQASKSQAPRPPIAHLTKDILDPIPQSARNQFAPKFRG